MEESVRHRFYPETVYYSESMLSDRGKSLIPKFNRVKSDIKTVSAKEMSLISDARTSQGILGVFKQPSCNISDITTGGACLLMDNIFDPGNAGTLIRSALAFNFNAVLYRDNTVDFFNPKVVRSSVGAIFGINLIPFSDDSIAEFRKKFKTIIAVADLEGDDPSIALKRISSKNMLILAVGSETEGLSDDIKETADLHLRIKHSGLVESLNAAVAGSLLMNEIYLRFGRKAQK